MYIDKGDYRVYGTQYVQLTTRKTRILRTVLQQLILCGSSTNQNETAAESCETSCHSFLEAILLEKVARSLRNALLDGLGTDGQWGRVQIHRASIEKLVLIKGKRKGLIMILLLGFTGYILLYVPTTKFSSELCHYCL